MERTKPEYTTETIEIPVTAAGQEIEKRIVTQKGDSKVVGFAVQLSSGAYFNLHRVGLRNSTGGNDILRKDHPANLVLTSLSEKPECRYYELEEPADATEYVVTWKDGTVGAFASYTVLATLRIQR